MRLEVVPTAELVKPDYIFAFANFNMCYYQQ